MLDARTRPQIDIDRTLDERALTQPQADGHTASAPLANGAAHTNGSALPDAPRRPTQKQRLAAWARAGRGIRQVDWAPHPPDADDRPIWRVAAIIGFLEDDGFAFEHRRDRRTSQVTYFLLRDPAAVARALQRTTEPQAAEQLPLLTPPPTSAIHGDL